VTKNSQEGQEITEITFSVAVLESRAYSKTALVTVTADGRVTKTTKNTKITK